MNSCAKWIATRSCGCERKSYLLLPYGFILMVRYLQRDEYSVDIYINSSLVHGETIQAISMCDGREKAICLFNTVLGKLIHSLYGIDPTDYIEE
jgi:hypothetical protein